MDTLTVEELQERRQLIAAQIAILESTDYQLIQEIAKRKEQEYLQTFNL